MVAETSNAAHSTSGAHAGFGPELVYDKFDDQPHWHDAGASSLTSARSLGILSLALGAGALLMPGGLARLGGLDPHRRLLPWVGLRELAAGVGLMSSRNPTPWLWSRVVGDGMDLAVILGSLLSGRNPRRLSAGVTAAVVGAITAIDVRECLRSARSSANSRQGSAPDALISASIIVSKTSQECYDFWRDPENMTRISPMVESVTVLDSRTSRWCIRSPLGQRIEWDSKITGEIAGERLSWRSVDGGGLYYAGVIRFERATGDRGTLVSLSAHLRVPGGSAGIGLAKLLGTNPRSEIREDLRRFKQLLETGEIPTTQGQPSGRRSLFGRMTREGRLSREESAG
jgi:uncharacterized membrane protein